MTTQHTMTDPTTQHPAELPAHNIEHPGLTADMATRPDHGEGSYQGSGKLVGRRALITGGDSGIGRAVALAYAREGADVVIVHLPDEEQDGQETVALIESAGRRGLAVPGDLRDEKFCTDVIERAVAELGGLDILVNNAAYQMAQPGGITEITTEQFDRVFKTNVYALFWLCKAAIPHLQPGSTIINTSSIEAYEPKAALFDYAATKAAIVNMTKSLAADLAEKGIRVNTVAPGPIWTPLIPATMPADQIEEFSDTPLGRAGQPAELAPAYVFLASQESSFITGERIGVTGGKPMP